MWSVHGKNGMHLIFLGNLLLKCFLQQSQENNLTLTTNSRRSRSAVFRTTSISKVHWPMLAVKPWAKTTGGSASLNSGRVNFIRKISHSIYCCWTTRVHQAKIKGWERNCKSISSLTVGQRNNQALLAFGEGWVFDCKQFWHALSSMLRGLPFPLLSVSSGIMTFHVSKLWQGEINKKGGS